MLAYEDTPDAQTRQISDEALTVLLSACNSEVKCAAIDPLAVVDRTPMPQADVYAATLFGVHNPLLEHQFKSYNLGNVLERTHPGIVKTTTNEETGARQFELTRAGTLAAALGGHLLKLSDVSSIAIRRFTGEQSNVEKPGRANTMEAHLFVLKTLFQLASRRTLPTTELAPLFEAHGIGEWAYLARLKQLIEAGLIERTERLRAGRRDTENHYRIKPDSGDGFHTPGKHVEEYLRIIDRFSAVDIDFLNEGLTHLHALTHDARKFPYMVKRSHLSKRVAKPASQKAARPVLPSGHVTPLRRYSSFRVGRESV